MQKKKSVITFVIILVLIIVGIGVGTGVYFFTDLFKSDKELFYKYLLSKNEILDIGKNINIESKNESYKEKTEINTIYEYDNSIENIENDQIIKNLQKNIKEFDKYKDLNAIINAKIDKQNKKASYQIELNKLDNNVINMDIVKNEDKYAIKAEEVLKMYVGLENNNIDRLAKKIGLQVAEYLPEKIDNENYRYNDLIKLDEFEKEHIKETYKELLYNEISEECYSKEKNVDIECAGQKITTNKYTLTLTKAKYIDLQVKILERLKTDSVTLNMIATKIKTVFPDSEYVNLIKINEFIQSYIERINEEEKTEEEYIKLNIYEEKGKTKKIELFIKKENKLNIEYKKENEEEKIYINQSFIKNESSAIIYDIKTSLLGIDNIIISKKNGKISIEADLYNIKDVYQNILNEKKSNYEFNGNETKSESETEDEYEYEEKIENTESNDIKEIEDIYNKYSSFDKPELLKIGFKIEFSGDENSEQESMIYLNVCNSKIGLKIKSNKEYTNDDLEIETLTNENSIMLNSFSKTEIEGIMKLYFDKLINIVNKRME